MEPKSIISITLLAIISACLIAIKACPQTENYGFYGDKSNQQGIHPLGSNNQHSAHIRDASNQLMDQNAINHPWEWKYKPGDDWMGLNSKCTLCKGMQKRLENHDDALEELHENLETNNAALMSHTINQTNSFMKTSIGGAQDYIRGQVDICIEPMKAYTNGQLTQPLFKQVSFIKNE